jgi:hypothetical protein
MEFLACTGPPPRLSATHQMLHHTKIDVRGHPALYLCPNLDKFTDSFFKLHLDLVVIRLVPEGNHQAADALEKIASQLPANLTSPQSTIFISRVGGGMPAPPEPVKLLLEVDC